jgi:Kdo2-lipid IVA lauroyltransferase/acyltransferase
LTPAIVKLGNVYRRLLAALLRAAGPEAAYQITGALARVLYGSLDVVRARSEAQCRAALEGHVPVDDVPRIARQAFTHRIWNLTDLMLADRLLHPGTYQRYGGTIPEPYRTTLLSAQRMRHPVVLLTAYYGPFDLLPIFLGYSGLRATVVYRPHANTDFDAYRRRIRARGGCELIPVNRSGLRLAEVLQSGGTVAIVADHHAGSRGVSETFLGLPTVAMRSVGLLAQHYGASVAAAGIRRIGPFRFEIVVSDLLHEQDWRAAEDPVTFITAHYLRALERIVLTDPAQYLWAHARWGEDFLHRLLEQDDGTRPARPPQTDGPL